ncbi:hypothetical protein KPL44_24745, partial [Clostridium sp. DSM 17811]
AGKLYFKYTNTWESTVEEVKDFGITGIDLGKGLVNLGADVLKSGYGLVKGAVVFVGAGMAMKSMMETGDAPDCLKNCITKTEGYGKTVSEVLKDPIIIAEGMAQSASDTVEEKGIAYSTSYVLGGVLLTKGLGKANSVFKARKAADVEKVATKVDKAASNTATVKYYRVQGGTPPNASRSRISIGDEGKISIPNKTSDLNISTGDLEHAHHFKNLRGEGAGIVEFEVPNWFDDFLKESAIPQKGYKNNPLNQGKTVPKIVDPSTPGTSYEFPAPWVEWIEEYGTNGKITK